MNKGEDVMSPFHNIRVLLADDHDIVVKGIESALAGHPDIEVGRALHSGEDLLSQILVYKPDIVLLDVVMPNFECTQALNKIAALEKPPYVLIFSALIDYSVASHPAVSGYILKEEALSNALPRAIRRIVQTGALFSPQVQRALSNAEEAQRKIELTHDQYQVLELMVKGVSRQEIATRLTKSCSAVYSIQQRIREKLGVDTSEQAIVRAISQHLVSVTEIGLELETT